MRGWTHRVTSWASRQGEQVANRCPVDIGPCERACQGRHALGVRAKKESAATKVLVLTLGAVVPRPPGESLREKRRRGHVHDPTALALAGLGVARVASGPPNTCGLRTSPR